MNICYSRIIPRKSCFIALVHLSIRLSAKEFYLNINFTTQISKNEILVLHFCKKEKNSSHKEHFSIFDVNVDWPVIYAIACQKIIRLAMLSL